MLPAFLRIRVSLFTKTSLFSFVSLKILQTFFFSFLFLFTLSLKFLVYDFERLQLKFLFFGISAPFPFIVGILFRYFCVVAYFWNSFLSSLAFSPSRISPLVWRFPLRRLPRVDSEYGNCSRGNSKNNSLFSAINPPRISRRSRDNRAPSTESKLSLDRHTELCMLQLMKINEIVSFLWEISISPLNPHPSMNRSRWNDARQNPSSNCRLENDGLEK